MIGKQNPRKYVNQIPGRKKSKCAAPVAALTSHVPECERHAQSRHEDNENGIDYIASGLCRWRLRPFARLAARKPISAIEEHDAVAQSSRFHRQCG